MNTKRLEVGDILANEGALKNQFLIDRVDEIQAYSGNAHFDRVPTNGYYLINGYSHMPNAGKYILYTFKDQVENDIIPRIKEMYLKENDHNNFLKDSRKNILMYSANALHLIHGIDVMIETSDAHLIHFKQRIEEYTEYLNKP